MKYMDKSRNRRESWWQRISTSSKVFCIVCIVCVIAVLTVGYFVKLSDPTASSAVNFMMAFCIFVIVIVMTGALILRTIDTANLDEIRGEIAKNLDDARTVHTQTNNLLQSEVDYIKEYTEFDGFGLDLDFDNHMERLVKLAGRNQHASGGTPPKEADELPEVLSKEQLAALHVEIQEERKAAETAGQDALDARYSKQEKLHNADVAKAKVAEGTGDNNREEPSAEERTSQPQGELIAEIVRVHTGEINVKRVKDAIRGNTSEQENQPPTGAMKDQPDSPEKAKEQVEEQPVKEAEEWPSIEKQAEELGVSSDLLRFWLHGKKHISQLSFAEQQKIKKKLKILA